MIADYHIHTRLCRHAEGEPREYVERAIAAGHAGDGVRRPPAVPRRLGAAPRPHGRLGDGPGRAGRLRRSRPGLAREYEDDVRIILGIEADFIPETLEQTAAVLEQYPFEYVIGSVHIVGDRFGFDHPEMEPRLAEYGIDRIHLESLELTRQAAESRLFDIIGHFDHAKKFGPPEDEEAVAAAASAALRAVAAAGMLDRAQHRRPAQSHRRAVPRAGAAGRGARAAHPARLRLGRPPARRRRPRLRPRRRSGQAGRLRRRHEHLRRRGRGAGVTRAGRRLAAIFNPHSGGGGYKRDVPLIFDALRGLGYVVDELETTEPGDAKRLAREAVSAGFDIVCAVGGDGTVNETINGLAGSDVPLAIIPTGTVNVLAMELGIPLEPPDAVKLLEAGTVSWIDLGLAGDRYFGLMAGVGMDAAVVASLQPDDEEGAQGGGVRRPGPRHLPHPRGPALPRHLQGADGGGLLRRVRQLVQLRRRVRHHAARRHARRPAGRLRPQGQVVRQHGLVLDRRADQRPHQAPQGRVLPHRERR